ncbi:uncharacterized protein PAE49_014616 [Odontesthes bonariensis]
MTRTEVSLSILFGLLLLADVCSSCAPDDCLRCNLTADCCQLDHTNTHDIKGINSSKRNEQAGKDITLECVHNFTDVDLTFTWSKDQEKLKDQKKGELVLKTVLSGDAGQYVCAVNSSCGLWKFTSYTVTVEDNTVVILVICGVAALVLVVSMGIVMKCKLKRDNAKYKERRMQRVQAEQTGGPHPLR